MMLKVKSILDYEIAHYADGEQTVLSKFNKITIKNKGGVKTVRLPVSAGMSILGCSRLLRRLLRLDKMYVLPNDIGYTAFFRGCVYHIPKDCGSVRRVMEMKGCRNPLHNAAAIIDGREIFFGEYGRPHIEGKSVYRSTDWGLTWQKVFNFSCNEVRHIHCCRWDPYEEKVWVFTGDFDGQCHIICADREFNNVEWIGDGSQQFRACNAFFEADAVHWFMDSPISEVHHIKLDRKTREIEVKESFPGPVWYSKKLYDGYYILATAQEIGPSHKDDRLHFFISRDLEHWEEEGTFRHDGLPKGYFKFGVAAFADGAQESSGFYAFFEAVKGLDGRVCSCALE